MNRSSVELHITNSQNWWVTLMALRTNSFSAQARSTKQCNDDV
jgi:hypothetical protein